MKDLYSRNSEEPRACLKNHSSNLHTPIYGIFCLHSVAVARYAALIQAKSPANCDVHLAESIFQTRSREEDGLSSVVSKLIERCYISQNEREYYKNIRLEESKLGANKVKLARKQYRGKGRYIDEILV